MPNPKDLHGFLGRTQKWLQKAMDEGDEQSVNYYERLMDRGGALAERMAQQQQQQSQEPALSMSGYMPVKAEEGTSPFNGGFPQLGRVMGVNQQQSQYNPDVMYNVPSGNGGGQQPQQQAPQQAVTPPQAGAEPVPMFSFKDLAEMNGNGGADPKLKMDLNKPVVPNPFAPAKSPEDTYFGQFPKKPSGNLSVKGSSPAAPEPSSAALPPFARPGAMLSPNSPTGSDAEFEALGNWFKELQGEANARMAGEKPDLSDIPVDPKTGKPVTFTEEQLKPGGVQPPATAADPGASVEPGVKAGDTSQLTKFDKDWAFRKRINDMSNYGLSADRQAANTAEFDRKAEMEKRIKEEYGDKPSVLMEIAGLLLGGARGLDAMSRKKAAYMQGRAAIGREMRNEKAMAQKQMLQYGRQKVEDEVARQKMFYATLSDAAKLEMRPHLAEIDRIGAQLTSLTNNPATKEDDPRIFKLQQALQEALDRAKQVTGQYYGQVIPQANKGNVQE